MPRCCLKGQKTGKMLSSVAEFQGLLWLKHREEKLHNGELRPQQGPY